MSNVVDKKDTTIEQHILAILVDNEFGVLSRVIGLFSARGYNISSVTVAKVDAEKNISRITIVTKGPVHVIEQIKAQLAKMIPVHTVRDLTVESPHLEREVALVKVCGEEKQHIEAQQLADRFGARTIDSTEKSFIFELTDLPHKLDKFIGLMEPLGLIEVCRTGATAMARGPKAMTIEE